jgi:hypothetical protein
LNGVRLRPGDDYTATNGTSITLISAAALNDELVVDAFGSFLVANTYTIAEVDAFAVKLTGNQSIAGNKNFAGNTLYVDDTNNRVGAGTASPSTNLHAYGDGSGTFGAYNDPSIVEGSTYTLQYLKGTNGVAASIYSYNSSNGWYVGTNNSASYRIGRMSSIDQTGVSNAKDSTSDGFILDTSGRIRMPSQPAFVAHASGNGNYLSVANNTAFPANATNYNQGSCYNTSNYRFTAPVTGLYLFTFSAIQNNSSGDSRPHFFVNNSELHLWY